MAIDSDFSRMECPSCQALILYHTDYVPWCNQCDWNLQPIKPEPPRTLLERFYISLGERGSRGLRDAVSKTESLRPTMTLARAGAYLIAMLVHILTLALLVLGIWLIIVGIPEIMTVVSIFLGLICLGMVWIMRPRFGNVPNEGVLTTEQAPTLHRLVQNIAAELRVRPVDYLVIVPDFNAWYGRVTWQQKRVLALGLPLFESLDNQEKVALISHELAHDANGDSVRGVVIGLAISNFIRWYLLLRPAHIWTPSAGIVGILMIPLTLTYFLLSGLGWVGAYLLVHLLWRDTQRAEYYADYLASTVGGTASMLGLLEKLYFANTFVLVLQKVALTAELRQENLFQILRERISTVPDHEIERIRRVQRLQMSRLNATHPPTAFRVDSLCSRPAKEGTITLSPADAAEIQAELAKVEPAVQKKLITMRRAGYLAH